MDSIEVKKLIDLFYNGETSHEDELKLLAYFKAESVAEELMVDKEVILALLEEADVETPPNLESNISSLIDSLERKDELAKKSKKNRMYLYIAGVAASFLVLLMAGINKFGLPASEPPVVIGCVDSFELSPEEARIEAEKALLLLAGNYTKGLSKLSHVTENIEKVNLVLDRSLNYKK